MGLVKDLQGFIRLFAPPPPYIPEEIAAALAGDEEVLFAAPSSLGSRYGFTTIVSSSYVYFNSARTASEVHDTERMIRIDRADITGVKKHGKGIWGRESVSISTLDGKDRRIFFGRAHDAQVFYKLLSQ